MIGMEDCIVCKIVDGKVPSYKVYEDANYIAILDAIPACEGQTIILSKEHKDSRVLLLRNEELTELALLAKKVASMLEKGLGVDRVQFVAAGTTVNHLHVKLYPTADRITVEGQKAAPEILRQTRERIIISKS
jgi:histidine triad (HIT) family protein